MPSNDQIYNGLHLRTRTVKISFVPVYMDDNCVERCVECECESYGWHNPNCDHAGKQWPAKKAPL